MLLFLFLVSRKEKERKYLSNLVQKFLKILESIPETGNKFYCWRGRVAEQLERWTCNSEAPSLSLPLPPSAPDR